VNHQTLQLHCSWRQTNVVVAPQYSGKGMAVKMLGGWDDWFFGWRCV